MTEKPEHFDFMYHPNVSMEIKHNKFASCNKLGKNYNIFLLGSFV